MKLISYHNVLLIISRDYHQVISYMYIVYSLIFCVSKCKIVRKKLHKNVKSWIFLSDTVVWFISKYKDMTCDIFFFSICLNMKYTFQQKQNKSPGKQLTYIISVFTSNCNKYVDNIHCVLSSITLKCLFFLSIIFLPNVQFSSLFSFKFIDKCLLYVFPRFGNEWKLQCL